MNILPMSRQSNLVVQELEKELLIYDLSLNKAFVLNETSAKVYQACDGKTSLDELKRKHQFTDEIIFLALDELQKTNLIAENSDYVSPFAGMKRREVIRKVGLASLIALPLISSVVAPSALMAASGAPPAAPAGAAGACPSPGSAGCQAGLTCKSCFGCSAPGVNAPACCSNSNPFARGPGLDPSVGNCTTQLNCSISAPQQCCKGTATWTFTGCGFSGTGGTCLCN